MSLSTILSEFFPNHNTVINYSPTHKVIQVCVKNFIQSPISNWIGNRPHDIVRCEEIADYLKKPTTEIELPFLLFYSLMYNRFEIIDGNNRYNALLLLNMDDEKYFDLITPSIFNKKIILNIRYNPTYNEVSEIFININKSIPVHDIYTSAHRDNDKNKIINIIINEYQEKHKNHFSTSTKPVKPNINRKSFDDLLVTLYDKLHINNNLTLFKQILHKANTIFKNNPPLLTDGQLQKCTINDCWLFVYSVHELETKIMDTV